MVKLAQADPDAEYGKELRVQREASRAGRTPGRARAPTKVQNWQDERGGERRSHSPRHGGGVASS